MFNKDYDRSLGLMLAGNKGKREMITDFLQGIPLELFNQLYKSLDEYQDYLKKNENIFVLDRDDIDLRGRFITSSDFLYFYSIEPITGALDLGVSIYYEEEESILFKMTIYPFTEEDYIELQMFNEFGLGEIYYNFRDEIIDGKTYTIDSDSTDFALVRCPLRDVVASYDKSNSMIRKYSFVDVKNISDIVNVSKVGKNRLVRSRKKYK